VVGRADHYAYPKAKGSKLPVVEDSFPKVKDAKVKDVGDKAVNGWIADEEEEKRE
jgi:hypothetical protein